MKRAEIVRLAHEISRDLDDPSVSTAVVVNKGLRLATFVDNEFWKKFFGSEATGYSSGDKDLDIVLQATWRWDGKSEEITSGPIVVLEANIKLWKRANRRSKSVPALRSMGCGAAQFANASNSRPFREHS